MWPTICPVYMSYKTESAKWNLCVSCQKKPARNGISMIWITDFSLSILWIQTGILIWLRKKCGVKDKWKKVKGPKQSQRLLRLEIDMSEMIRSILSSPQQRNKSNCRHLHSQDFLFMKMFVWLLNLHADQISGSFLSFFNVYLPLCDLSFDL